jgi:hypothetical protein
LATKSDAIRPVADGETADVAGSIRPVTGRRIRGNWRPVSAPWSPRHIRDRLQGTIRPVVSQRIRGESESIRPVNAMRRRPAIGQPIRGARGEHYPPRYRRYESAPVSVSVDAPLPPVNSGKPAGSIRPVTDVAGAPLPHQRPQFRSHSGRLHPPQATREHRGELQRRAGASGDYTAANLASDGTAHGAITSALAKCEKSREYREASQTPLTGDYARPTELGRTAHGNLPRPATYRYRSHLARGIGAENLPLGGRVTQAARRVNFHEIGESTGLATVDSGLTLRGNQRSAGP